MAITMGSPCGGATVVPVVDADPPTMEVGLATLEVGDDPSVDSVQALIMATAMASTAVMRAVRDRYMVPSSHSVTGSLWTEKIVVSRIFDFLGNDRSVHFEHPTGGRDRGKESVMKLADLCEGLVPVLDDGCGRRR
jgi:hypothetical protein